MTKSLNRKARGIQSKKDRQAKNPKRKDKRRGKHGCSRLHELREKRDGDEIITQDITIHKTKPGFIDRLKNKLLRN